MGWTPPDGICVPRWRCRTATEGGVHGASYHDRFGPAPICRHWRAGPRPSTLKLHVNCVIITALGNRGRTAHSGFAVSEAGEKVVDCAGMPLTTARRANSARIESVSDLAKGREPGSLDRPHNRQ